MNINWMTPAQWQALHPDCPSGRARHMTFGLVAAVTLLLLVFGVPGASLPMLLLAVAALTVVVGGGSAPGLTTLCRAAAGVAGLWPRGQVTS